MPVVLFVVAAILLLVIFSGTYVFLVACHRKKDLPWLVEEEIKKTPYGQYHACIAAADQWLRDHHAQSVTVTSVDGYQLHGYWIPTENAKGSVLLAHGYRSTMLLDFGAAFEVYHDLGLNILVPDQRCHGKSQGRFITFGVKESEDMIHWIEFHNLHFGNLPMILYGMSMGASTMLYLADKDLPGNIKGIIADCGFTSPKDILASVFKSVTHMPAGLSLLVTEVAARIFAGFSLTEEDTRRTLASSRLPVLMIHGTRDTFVPCRMSKEAYAACASEKELLLVENAEHGVSFLEAPQRYSRAVIDFIKKYLR